MLRTGEPTPSLVTPVGMARTERCTWLTPGWPASACSWLGLTATETWPPKLASTRAPTARAAAAAAGPDTLTSTVPALRVHARDEPSELGSPATW